MTDEIQEEQVPEAEAATETTTDEIGGEPAAEVEQVEAGQGDPAESDQEVDTAGEEQEQL